MFVAAAEVRVATSIFMGQAPRSCHIDGDEALPAKVHAISQPRQNEELTKPFQSISAEKENDTSLRGNRKKYIRLQVVVLWLLLVGEALGILKAARQCAEASMNK